MTQSASSRAKINTKVTQAASGQASRRPAGQGRGRRPAGQGRGRRPAPGQPRMAGDVRGSSRDPGREVVELDHGILIYPPREAGEPWRLRGRTGQDTDGLAAAFKGLR